MDDVAQKIYELLMAEGMSADKITHALACIGDGKMDVGIKRVADFFMEEGIDQGEKRGLKKGSVGGVIGGVAIASISYALIRFFKKRIDEKKELSMRGKTILKALEETDDDTEKADDTKKSKVENR